MGDLERHSALLVAGTDTEVGKTVFTCALVAYWQRYLPAQRLGVLKPIQAGYGDRERYASLLAGQQSLEEITPLYFPEPLAPPIAAAKAGKTIDLKVAWQTFAQLTQQKDWVLVEALGGLGSPITEELTVADLARDWHLPVVLVAPVRLGSIGHLVANVALARQHQIPLQGIVLNCATPDSEAAIENLTPTDLIQSLTQVPVLGCLPYGIDGDGEKAIAAISHLHLEAFLPHFFVQKIH
nr:dethiobiotin synthase [Geitlerinema sp. PCC 9228]